MTTAMWFAWALRDDVRAGAALDDQDAQRDFVCWWLLHGRADYPGAWWYGPAQAAVAMEPVAMEQVAGEQVARLPRLLARLLRDRPDLARFHDDPVGLLCWYRLHAPGELAAAPALPAAALKRTEAGRPPRIALMQREARADVAAAVAGPAALAAWFAAHGRAEIPPPTPPPAGPEPVPPAPYRRRGLPRGVNLVGFARGELGIGEDVRMAAAALGAAGIAHVVIDIAPPPGARRQDDTLAARLSDALRYDVTLFCLMVFDVARLFLERGPGFFAGRTNIGAFPWELAALPSVWTDALSLVDEIWAPSRYVQAAFAGATAKPVVWMPPAVALPATPLVRRAAFGLPEDAFVFVYPFDPASFLARKNPLAAVRAFRRAFPLGRAGAAEVALLLRVNGQAGGKRWSEVTRAIAGDRRIHVHQGTLARRVALGLLRRCDCLVSPHRAEGFGRNIAEAILLGLPVLATGYSGCLDFLRPDEAVAWTPRPIGRGEYPFADGQSWAEPDLDDLAGRMRDIVGAPRDPGRGRALARIHGVAPTGARYAARLATLAPSRTRP